MTASTTMTSITISPKLYYQQHRIDDDCINNIVHINVHADNTGSNLIDFDRLDEDTINTIVESTIASTKDDDCIDDDINQDIVASTFTTTTT